MNYKVMAAAENGGALWQIEKSKGVSVQKMRGDNSGRLPCFSKELFDDGDILYLLCSVWQPLAPCGSSSDEMWLSATEEQGLRNFSFDLN